MPCPWASPERCGLLPRRLVRESNPSHPIDSGVATQSRHEASFNIVYRVESRGVTDGDRTRLRRVTTCPRRQTSTVTMTVGHPGIAPGSLALQASAITRLAHDPLTLVSAPTEGDEDEPARAEGIEPSRGRLTTGCLTIGLHSQKMTRSPRLLPATSSPRRESFERCWCLRRQRRPRSARWDARPGRPACDVEFSRIGAREGVSIQRRSQASPPWRQNAAVVPRAGLAPALPVSETRVLTLDDLGRRREIPDGTSRASRLGGDRTLASPGKSRVRFCYATSLWSGTRGASPSSAKSRVPYC